MGHAKKFLLRPQSSLVFLDFAKFFWLRLFTTCPMWEVGFGYKSRGTDGKPRRVVKVEVASVPSL
jgi:hypothetical protein